MVVLIRLIYPILVVVSFSVYSASPARAANTENGKRKKPLYRLINEGDTFSVKVTIGKSNKVQKIECLGKVPGKVKQIKKGDNHV